MPVRPNMVEFEERVIKNRYLLKGGGGSFHLVGIIFQLDPSIELPFHSYS